MKLHVKYETCFTDDIGLLVCTFILQPDEFIQVTDIYRVCLYLNTSYDPCGTLLFPVLKLDLLVDLEITYLNLQHPWSIIMFPSYLCI